MFDGKVIYKKKFPPVDMGEEKPARQDEPKELPEAAEKKEHLTYEEVIAELTKGNTYIPMPGRLVSAEEFINLAKKISEDLHADVQIARGEYQVEVSFWLDWFQESRLLKPLFVLADDFHFIVSGTKEHLAIVFVYYTHLIVRRGKLHQPNF